VGQENILVNDPTCHACPVACKKEVEVKEGPWKGLRMESSNTSLLVSRANCGNPDARTVAKMIDLAMTMAWMPSRLDILSLYGWKQSEGTQR